MKLMQKVEKGFTLIELLIVITILSMVTIGLSSSMRSGTDVWQTENTHTERLQNALIGMDKMTRELKQARSIDEVEFIVDDKGVPIINEEDGSVSYKSIDFIDVKDVSSNFRYNNNYVVYNDAPLAGPITSLKFTCYDITGIHPINDPAYSDRIRLVKIDMVAGSGNSISVPVSSAVSFGDIGIGGGEYNDPENPPGGGGSDHGDDPGGGNEPPVPPGGGSGLYNYAIFGGAGFEMKNNAWIGSYQSYLAHSYKDPPANIGTLASGEIKNNLTLYGSVVAGVTATIQKADVISGDCINNADFTKFHLPEPMSSGTYINWTNQALTPGKYYFNSIPGDVNINISDTDLLHSNGVQIFVKGDLGDNDNDINITLNGKVPDPNNPKDMEKVAMIYVEVQGNISMKNNASLIGTFYASKGNIISKNNLAVYGSLYAKGIVEAKNNLDVFYVPANINVLPPTW
jgi:prepilin-type N-terminal cleavage/methylation domain-containing protein